MVEVTARILEDLLKVEGVSAALLVGRDGFVIEKVGDIADVDALGALSVSLLGAAETIAKIGGSTGVEILSVESDKSYFLACNVTSDIFLAIVSQPSNMGRLRYEVKKIRLKLQAAL